MNNIYDEDKRLEEVRRFLQLDFDRKSEFKEITDLASELCNKPISLITLLDKDINWIKVASGIDVKESPREISFCQYGIQQDDVLIIPDATEDSRFDDNPLVYDMGVKFYAGVPLVSSNGYKLGTLCLFDQKPGSLTELQQRALTALSKHVTFLMEMKLGQQQLVNYIKEIETKNESLRAIAQLQSHEIRQPLTSVIGLVNLVTNGVHKVDDEWLQMMKEATTILDGKIHAIVNESMGNKDMKLLRFNKMVEEIEDYAILLLDKDGNIENWNRGAEKIKGYRADEIIGKNFSLFYTPDNIAINKPQQLLQEAIANGTANDEGWRVRKDGSTFWAKVLITAIHNDNNEVIGFTKVTRDLTNIK